MRQPLTVHLPAAYARNEVSLQALVGRRVGKRARAIRRLISAFELCPDEVGFARTLLRAKSNLWLFRTNQRNFCGDFIVVDMSSARPQLRRAVAIELKRCAALTLGGGRAGMHFARTGWAMHELAVGQRLLEIGVQPELAVGDRVAVLRHLGCPV